MRGINKLFINDLLTGELSFFLEQAKSNPSICLEIRNNYINLYFRGGNALRITQVSKGYHFYFDLRYCHHSGDQKNYCLLKSLNSHDVMSFQNHFPIILEEMTIWLNEHPNRERDFQHNLIKSNQTDFIIIDIEYAGRYNETNQFRLDMIAIYKSAETNKLVLVENKYGRKVDGKSGIGKHYSDIVEIFRKTSIMCELTESTKNIANNKYELGLLREQVELPEIIEPEILFIFADYSDNPDINMTFRYNFGSHPTKKLFMSSKDTHIDYKKATVM